MKNKTISHMDLLMVLAKYKNDSKNISSIWKTDKRTDIFIKAMEMLLEDFVKDVLKESESKEK